MRQTTIYALVDPRGLDRIRYVGKTSAPLKHRLQNHIQEAKRGGTNHRLQWIRSLLRDEITPSILALDTVPISGDWAAEEQWWIANIKLIGYDLTNATIGGEGAPGHTPSQETRAKMSLAHKGHGRKSGFTHSEESIERMRAAHRGHLKTPEHKAKIGAAHTGKKRAPFSEEWRAKLSEAHSKKRGPLSATHKEKLRAATLAYYARKNAARGVS